MSQHEQFEEEEFDTEFNGQTVARILRQGLLHWPLMFGYTAGDGCDLCSWMVT